MARRGKVLNIVLGVIIGLVVSSALRRKSEFPVGSEVCNPQKKPDHRPSYNRLNFVVNGAANSSKDNLLLVGVMTAAKYVHNRAKTVYETWGKEVPGRIVFFSSEFSYSDEIPLVGLPGIDDSYPPQRKSFTMLKYMHDNYIDKYEWFLRADDDVYVRTDRLEALLRSVDSRKPWFIGQTGRGNNDEFGLLSLEDNENFCMGGPGVIFSRETLKRMAPNIDKCLGNLYTTHEDVELGRCVRKFAGVPCTWSYEMQVILYHNQSGEAAFSGDLKQKEVHRAITMHPVKHPQYMNRLHNYVKALKIQEKQQESIDLHRDIASSMLNMGITREHLSSVELIEDLPLFPEPPGSDGYLGDPELLGTPITLNRFASSGINDVLDWELISKSLYSYKDLNPKKRIGSMLKEGLSDVVREVMELINSYSKQRGRIIDFREILYGYWRLDPLHGVDVILDMSLTYKKYRGHKMTVPVRRHAYIQQTFTDTHIKEVNVNENERVEKETDSVQQYKTSFFNNVIAQIGVNLPLPSPFNSKTIGNSKYINFILPLSGRHETFKRFIRIYEDICIKEQELTRLLVVLYKNENTLEDFLKSVDLIRTVQQKYPESEVAYKVITEPFSRGRALQHGVDTYHSNDLVFFIDVDVVFNHKSLLRIRQNTIIHKKVYFPIVYSLYNPRFVNRTLHNDVLDNYELSLNDQNGFWRQFGFGIASLYKSDFVELGGFNTSINGWGLEDVAFYDNIIKSSRVKIVRSVDTGLVHVFHPVNCDTNLEQAQKDMCLGTKANILGSLYDLQNIYLQYKYLFR